MNAIATKARIGENSILQQQLFTIAFVDLSVKNILDSSALFNRPEWMDTMFLLIFFACMGWKLLLQRFTRKSLIIMAVFGVISAYISFKMHYFFLIFTFFGIAGCQNIDLRRVLRYTSLTKIIMILIHVVPYVITAWITPDQITYVYRNGVQRQHFYIGHPNTFSMYVGWAILEFIYAYQYELKKKHLVLLWLVDLIVYQYTDSNTSLIVGTLTIGMILAAWTWPEKMARLLTFPARYLFAIFSVFFTAISIGFTSMPDGLKLAYFILNELLTGRLIYGAFAYENYGIAWLGNLNVRLEKTTYFEGVWVDALVFDNAYIYLLVYYAAIFLIILSGAFIIIGKDKAHDPERNMDKIMIISYALFAVMENYILNGALCFSVLFIGKYLYQMYENGIDKKKAKVEKIES